MKKIIIPLILILIVSCKQEKATKYKLQDDVYFLASDSLKGRATGTEQELQAAAYIKERMQGLSLKPAGDSATYYQTFSFTPKTDPHQEVAYVHGEGAVTGTNVIGFLDNKAKHTVIIGAHYDHLGMGGQGSLYREGKAIHNGADDNASGVAVMLQLADSLQQNGPKNNNYLFMAFSGEEIGLLGSNYFAKNPTINLDEVTYMINMDMVGRLREDKTLSISGTGTSPIWKQVLNATNPGFKLVLKESGVGPSDHTSFYLQDIPVLHFFTGQHSDYHKPTDDADKLNYEGMQMITGYITEVVRELDDNPKLVFKKTKNESDEVPRFKVTLGVVPDYLFDGKGMRIDGISEDRPAQKAGLRKGDVVVQMGDSTVVDMMGYMRALSAFEKGNTTKVVVDRNGEKVTVDITF
ncbi:M20/M25/M40 family metallo-hydrolase [Maribacter sp. ANRC-HE7]|uniref:M20/M25/M40 family metallo-hydrolase n=1 Tax=Maribacter aquimaris TaxID=2737171 RepID=A0ABR7V4M6_9FLAO|nr:M20/M25/M40 family metallo-hydrolase [Maribacter aquimaris]MBD0779759.1 M20/M25/M40 family metallo-hydrolase [Maribacter aquimaris]